MRFNQVFVALLALSFLSSFVIPPRYTNPVRGIQGFFAPVAWPARKIASSARERWAPMKKVQDDRAVADVKEENAQLRAMVLQMSGEITEMQRVIADRNLVPDVLRSLCTPFRVIGSEPTAHRESLILAASSRDGLVEKMPVLYAVGVVGRIDHVSVGGAQVQLITDPASQASGRFCRYLTNEAKKTILINLQSSKPWIRGAGHGQMIIGNIPLSETQYGLPKFEENDGRVGVGDVVALDDPDWPPNMKSQLMGRVEKIVPQTSAPKTAEITVTPMYTLSSLREVSVMNKAGENYPTGAAASGQ